MSKWKLVLNKELGKVDLETFNTKKLAEEAIEDAKVNAEKVAAEVKANAEKVAADVK